MSHDVMSRGVLADVGMELTARKNPLAVAGVQERRHVDQGGFWGDMNRTFQVNYLVISSTCLITS